MLIAYHALTPIACLSMKEYDEGAAIIDGLYFSFDADASMAANLLDEAVLLAKQMDYQKVYVKKRILPQMDIGLLGFKPSNNPRNLCCNLSPAAQQKTTTVAH